MLELEDALFAAMGDREFVTAMREGVDAFDRYRSTMPLATRSYTRTKLRRLDGYELVGMLWAPGSRSPIHDHGASRCWVVMLEGALDIENYQRSDDNGQTATLQRGENFRIERGDLDHRGDWRELHRVGNSSDAPAYSIQLYAAPLAGYTVILNESTGAWTTTTSDTDAIYEL